MSAVVGGMLCKSDKPSIIIIIIRVDRSLIWLRLEERGINGECLDAIKAMYDKVTQKVKVGSFGVKGLTLK